MTIESRSNTTVEFAMPSRRFLSAATSSKMELDGDDIDDRDFDSAEQDSKSEGETNFSRDTKSEDGSKSASSSEKDTTARLFPRKKKGEKFSLKGKDRKEVIVDETALRSLFHCSMLDAAKELAISVTSLKRLCRTFGIYRWPYTRKRQITPQARRNDSTPSSGDHEQYYNEKGRQEKERATGDVSEAGDPNFPAAGCDFTVVGNSTSSSTTGPSKTLLGDLSSDHSQQLEPSGAPIGFHSTTTIRPLTHHYIHLHNINQFNSQFAAKTILQAKSGKARLESSLPDDVAAMTTAPAPPQSPHNSETAGTFRTSGGVHDSATPRTIPEGLSLLIISSPPAKACIIELSSFLNLGKQAQIELLSLLLSLTRQQLLLRQQQQ